ncbi:hypothetical protein ACF0H5_020380 [Mactra antiquata]
MATTQKQMNGPISMTALNPDGVPRCNTHRKRLKFFCSKHQLLLCSVCAVKRHRSCAEVLTINEACEEKKNEGNKLLDNYSQKISVIENAIVERKAAKKLLDTNAQEIHNEVHEVTEKLIDLVKHEERMIVDTVQNMQQRESEVLDKDISDLEETCDQVKRAHDTLSQSLKFSDVDLIYAVIKEYQKGDDDINVESVVKKRFKEIDFKFTVSPHITSFMKHFKNLGQVMLSDDRGNSNRVSRSNMSTPVNDNSSVASSSISSRQLNTSDESYITARERWARDRRRQLQLQQQQQNFQLRSPSSDDTPLNDNVFYPEHVPQQQQLQPRRQPMRALPLGRPITPDVYNNTGSNPRPREFVPRPMSTPPVESNTYNTSPKSRDVNRFQSTNRYRTTRPEPVYLPERSLPTPKYEYSREQPRQNAQNSFHSEVSNEAQRRLSTDALSPRQKPASPRSPPQTSNRQLPGTYTANPPSFSIVSVKETDVNFGRSFAAVQINDTATSEASRPEQPSPPTYQSKATISLMPVVSGDEASDHDLASESGRSAEYNTSQGVGRQATPNQRSRQPSPRLNESFGFMVSNGQRSTRLAMEMENSRRWVLNASFTSHGISSKRLISGIAMLQDDRIILVDQEHYCVQLYSKFYKFVAELKLDSRPFDVDVVSDNKVVVSLQSERVLKFILVSGDGLTCVADLGVPCDMVCYGVCKGFGFYSVCCGDEVWILSEEGRVVNRLKTDLTGKVLFIQAEYITVDSSGNVLYVSDAGSNKILAIHADGRRLWEFTYQGFKPSGVKYLDSYIFVCDIDQHRILMLNHEGRVVKQSVIGRLENPRALSFNENTSTLVVTQMKYDAIVSPPKPIHIFTLN